MERTPDVFVVVDDPFIRRSFVTIAAAESPLLTFRTIESASAFSEINRVRPQIVVVHNELVRRDGLTLAAELIRLYEPKIVLLAENDAHARRAYDAGVCDYISVPLRRERVALALNRASKSARLQTLRPRIANEVSSERPHARLALKSRGGIILVNPSDIVWASADGNYLDLHCLDRMHRIRETLSEFHERLSSHEFLRIHRSLLVNSTFIRELKSCGMGEYVLLLQNGKELSVSRKCRAAVERWITGGSKVAAGSADTLPAESIGTNPRQPAPFAAGEFEPPAAYRERFN